MKLQRINNEEEDFLKYLFLLSLLIHLGFIFLSSSWLGHKAEFAMQAPENNTSVDLVEATPTPFVPVPQVPKVQKIIKSKEKPLKKEIQNSNEKPSKASSKIVEENTGSSSSNTTSTARPNSSAKPDYLRNPPPPYPEAAKRDHEEGLVLLSVEVSEGGSALAVSLVKSSGFSKLDEAAKQAVKNWKFKPAIQGGVNISSRVEVPVRFKLNSH